MMTDKLAERRILVVEDGYFIASDIRRALVADGAIVIGPVGSSERGLALAREGAIDAAVLDINIGETTTYPIADHLKATGIPWLFVTGYDAWSIPADYRTAPRLEKPFTVGQIVDTLATLIAGRTAA